MHSLENNVRWHKLIEQASIENETKESYEKAEQQLSVIDEERKQYKINAENKYQKIKPGRILFSQEAVEWIPKKQLLQILLQFHTGRKVNKGNLQKKPRNTK